MTATTTDAAPGTGLGRLRRSPGSARPGSALYLILVFVLAMIAVGVLAGLFWTGVGLLILVVGLPIIVLSLFIARGFGRGRPLPALAHGLPEIAEPEWRRDTARPPDSGRRSSALSATATTGPTCCTA